jgi:hypothetical protein
MKTFEELKETLEQKNVALPQLKEDFYEYAEIADKKKFNPKNPEIIVKGVGKFTLEQLKKNVEKKLEDLVAKWKVEDFATVDEMLNPKSILPHFVKGILDVEKELVSPNTKRRLTLRKKSQEARETQRKIMQEATPPGMEDWVVSNKKKFVSQYGKEKGMQVLYSLAWKKYNEKKK